MTSDDKRTNTRIDSPNLLSYICRDEDDNEITQGMGRTLNVSGGGIMLETHVPIDPQLIVTLTIALEDDLMDFKGKIAHTRKRENGKFEFGIEFIEMNDEKRLFLKQYILLF